MRAEERRFTRVPFQVYTELKTKDAVYTSNLISNLSVGGCLLPVHSDIVPGTDCKILISLEGSDDEIVIKITGQVMRVNAHSVAVKFKLIDPESLFHLQNIIRYNAADPDKVEDEFSRHPGLL